MHYYPKLPLSEQEQQRGAGSTGLPPVRSDAPPRCARPLERKAKKKKKRNKWSKVSFPFFLFAFTFSLGSPPPPPSQLAFHLAALSPRRAAVVSKYGCHQRRPLERGAGITWTRRLDSPLYLSVVSLRCSLIALRPRLWRTLGLYFRLFFFFFFFFIPSNQGEGLRVSLFLYHLRNSSSPPAHRETVFAAQRGSSQQHWSRLLRSSQPVFAAPLQKFWHQPLWIQSCRTPIYLLPSFLIRVQSWLSGRCDITSDTHQLTPLLHPVLF